MSRQFCLSRISFLNRSYLATSFIDPWGEDDPITRQILEGEFDEIESLNYWAFFVSSAPNSSLVLDVGAFTGLFALVAGSLRSDVKAIAFEPAAVTFGRLTENIRWNKRDMQVIPANLAASDRTGFLRLPHQFGILSMSPGESLDSTVRPDHTQTVTAITLDMLLNERCDLPDFLNSEAIPFGPLQHISAVKIDVEGHEVNVLQGAVTLIDKFRPPLICEALNAEAMLCLSGFFDKVSYRKIDIEKERNIVFIPEEVYEQTTYNFKDWCGVNGEMHTINGERVLTYLA
jgi:FkbM family methyltransferase